MATLATYAFDETVDVGSSTVARTAAVTALANENDLPALSNVPPAYPRAVYQPSRRSGPFALAGSAAVVLAMVAAIATMSVISRHEERRHLTVVALRDLDTKVKAAPPPTAVEPDAEAPAPVVIPKPAIELPAPGPQQIAVDVPPPPPQVSAPVMPSVAPVTKPAAEAPRSPAVREGGDLSGTVLAAKPPVYPTEARRRHEQGTVKLLVLVDIDGRVADITIASSSGSTLLDKAALRAVKNWRWTPSKQNGSAAAVRGYVTIPFILKDEAASAT